PAAGGGTWTTVRLWDGFTGKKLRDLDRRGGCLAFSPDGKFLATGGDTNRLISLWDPATGRELRRWPAHETSVTALAFAADGKTLASGGSDQRVRLWDPATGREKLPLAG